MILLIDNYDSFTFNLVQALGALGADLQVAPHDAMTLDDAAAMKLHGLMISPGPGGPDATGVSRQLIKHFLGRVPILGVCLGMQAIGDIFDVPTVHAPTVMHGKVSSIQHDGRGLFAGIRSPMEVMRYHSLMLQRESLPEELVVTAETEDGVVMGIRHRDQALYGVQFHPESYRTPEGRKLLENYLKITRSEACV